MIGRGMIRRLRRLQREFLGMNRRNHEFLFRWNRADRFALVDDKLATKQLLAAHGVPLPPVLLTCDAPFAIRPLRARLARYRQFVLKPVRGAGGGGIVVIVERDGETFVKASGERLRWPDVAAHAADVIAGVYSLTTREDVLLVEGLVVSHPALAALAVGGVPDLRVIVLRGVPVLAMLRVPTARSDGRANLHLGGIGLGVDLGTGTTTYGVAGGHLVSLHPDLGVPLAGVRVPDFEETLRLAVRAADAVGLGFVGVDVVIDARYGPQVLELNARPGLAIQLANRRGLRPLLERVSAARLPRDLDGRVAYGRALACASRGGAGARGANS